MERDLTVPVDISDTRIAKAYAHPIRIEILTRLENRVASASEIAREIDASLPLTSYHFRKLASFGLIELVKQVPRRGSVESYYTAKVRPTITDEGWAQTARVVKRAIISGRLRQTASERGGCGPGRLRRRRHPPEPYRAKAQLEGLDGDLAGAGAYARDGRLCRRRERGRARGGSGPGGRGGDGGPDVLPIGSRRRASAGRRRDGRACTRRVLAARHRAFLLITVDAGGHRRAALALVSGDALRRVVAA